MAIQNGQALEEQGHEDVDTQWCDQEGSAKWRGSMGNVDSLRVRYLEIAWKWVRRGSAMRREARGIN